MDEIAAGNAPEADLLKQLPRIPGGGRIKYLQVIDEIERAIAAGKLPAGSRLPGHRDMARQLGVTIATLTKAVTELSRGGLLITRIGAGTFVAGPAPGDSAALRRADLGLNLTPTGPVAALLGDALAGLRRGDAADFATHAFGYAPIGGDAATRALGAGWIAARGHRPDAANVLAVGGAHEGILAALRAVTRPGDAILCEALTYSGLWRIADLLQLRVFGVPVSPEGLDVEAFARLCRESGATVAVLTPVTQNPTAAVLGHEARRAVLAAAAGAGVLVIEDDIYGHLADDPQPTLAALAPERVIYVTSLSKSVAPGLRLGFVAGPAALMPVLRQALYDFGWTAPALHAAIAARLVEEGAAPACVAAQRAEALARCALAARLLGPALSTGGGAASYHGWLRLPPHRRAEEVAAELLLRNVAVAPARHFMQAGAIPPEALRLSFGAIESRAAFGAALRTVAAVLARPGQMAGGIV